MSLRLAIGFACLLTAAALAAPTPAQQRKLEGYYSGIVAAGERLSARDVARYALEAGAVGETSAKLALALDRLRTQQELRKDNPNFGNFRWYRGQPEVRDKNAVQFVSQSLLVLALKHAGALDPANQAALKTLLTDAAQGCLNQRVRPDYTNIYLMKACNLVLLGQYLGDATLTAQGRANLRDFLTYARTNGITEFNSTTYTGVDMDCAIQLIRLARDPADQETGRTLLRMLWIDVAANWFEPAQRLAGAHSRDYDYLRGTGATDEQLADNGWLPAGRPGVLQAEDVSRHWPAPKEWTEKIRAQVPREVIQRWLAGPGSIATHWITPDYSIGTGGTGKAYDDKMFAVQFAGSRRDTMVYFVMESRNDPYGISREPDSNGHSKSLHLRPALVTAQSKDRALLLAADDTEKPRHLRPVPELKGLWSHLVFPSDAKLCAADGSAIGAGPLPGAYAYVRKGPVTLGLHFIAAAKAWNSAGDARLAINHVRDGDQVGAARLTVEHGTGPRPGAGLVAFAAETALTKDEASFRAFARRFESQRAVLTVGKNSWADISVGELAATLDLRKSKVIKVSGGSPFAATDILRINGEDPWTPLIDAALAR